MNKILEYDDIKILFFVKQFRSSPTTLCQELFLLLCYNFRHLKTNLTIKTTWHSLSYYKINNSLMAMAILVENEWGCCHNLGDLIRPICKKYHHTPTTLPTRTDYNEGIYRQPKKLIFNVQPYIKPTYTTRTNLQLK